MTDVYQFDSEQHIHTLNGKPLTGTSSVVGVLYKPLSWWASGKAVEILGWTNSKKVKKEERIKTAEQSLKEIKELTPEEYLKLLDKAYRNHYSSLNKSAKKGTDLHAILEKYVKSQLGQDYKLTEEETKLVEPFIKWSEKNVKKFIASEAHCYSKELWVGGITDCIAELNDGSVAVIDFKSSREAYPSQFLQTAGYAIQIEDNGLFSANGKLSKKLDKPITKLIIVPFGAEEIVPSIRNQIDQYKQGFKSAVNLYRLLGMDKLNK